MITYAFGSDETPYVASSLLYVESATQLMPYGAFRFSGRERRERPLIMGVYGKPF